MPSPGQMLRRYARWLHGRWPAGEVEKLPEIGIDGTTNVPGLYVVGDLTGVPLLKLSADSGVRAVRHLLAEPGLAPLRANRPDGTRDVVIVGAGVSGMAAALEARAAGLDIEVIEAKRRFQTIADFPVGKSIYTYPPEMTPAGEMRFTAGVKEALLTELDEQTAEVSVTKGHVEAVERDGGFLVARLAGGRRVRALRVIAAIGRSGNFRELGVPGEERVLHRLHDPKDHCDQRVLVVGGGDSAVETALALSACGADVTLPYRGAELTRPKPDNLAALAADERIQVELETTVRQIREGEVVLARAGADLTVANDVVFSMTGREAPLDWFRRSGVRIAGEWTRGRIAGLAAFFLFCVALYNWKSGGFLDALTREAGAFPYSLGDIPTAAGSLFDIVLISAQGPAFWYTLAYSTLVLVFGLRRIRKRRTPYVTVQTASLIAIQIVPLFLLPEIILPYLDAHGLLPAALADGLFPRVDYGHGREFWRAYGFILAWPLSVYNVFTDQPNAVWLGISAAQTLVIIPALIYFYGKGAYCGWICSCGALAETLGDSQRHKMPHGRGWNRLNLAGQVLLALALLLLVVRITLWVAPDIGWLARAWSYAFTGGAISWKWTVDVFLAGAIGYGVYFWLSGRFWCRFFCPLAALMHIYARFSSFRILADKKKCISCNVCTSVCHQGIDIMGFANKGDAMADPECVRCSACVLSCPTGVLTFGRVARDGRVIATDRLAASPMQTRETS